MTRQRLSAAPPQTFSSLPFQLPTSPEKGQAEREELFASAPRERRDLGARQPKTVNDRVQAAKAVELTLLKRIKLMARTD